MRIDLSTAKSLNLWREFWIFSNNRNS